MMYFQFVVCQQFSYDGHGNLIFKERGAIISVMVSCRQVTSVNV